MEIGKHVRTALRLFSAGAVLYLVLGAVVAYGSLFSFGLLAGPLVGGFVHAALAHKRSGRPVGLGTLAAGFRNLGNLFLLSLLLILLWLGVGILLPALILVAWWSYIPAILLLVSLAAWWVYVPALIVDKGTSLWRAMRESKARVTERAGFFPHLGFVVLVLALPPLAVFGLSGLFPPAALLHFLVCPVQLLALASMYDDPPVVS